MNLELVTVLTVSRQDRGGAGAPGSFGLGLRLQICQLPAYVGMTRGSRLERLDFDLRSAQPPAASGTAL